MSSSWPNVSFQWDAKSKSDASLVLASLNFNFDFNLNSNFNRKAPTVTTIKPLEASQLTNFLSFKFWLVLSAIGFSKVAK